MSKVRIYEVAKELGMEQKALVALFQSMGFGDVRNHMSSVEAELIDRVRRHLEKQKSSAIVEERIRPTVVKRRSISGEATASRPAESESGTGVAARVPADGPSLVEALPVTPVARPSRTRKDEALPEPSATKVEAKAVSRTDPARASAASFAEEPEHEASGVIDAVHAPTKTAPLPSEAPGAESFATGAAADSGSHTASRRTAAAKPVPPESEPAPAQAPIDDPSALGTEPTGASTRPQPRTGIETWAGRPGVPMPQPSGARPSAPPPPRRVQYDPRAGSGPAARSNARPGGPMGGRPMGRPGQGGMRRFGMGASIRKPPAAVSTQEMSAHKKVIRIEESVSLQTLAQRMSLKATEVLMKLLSLGMTGVNINSSLDADTAKIIASEFGWEVEDVAVSEEQAIEKATGPAEINPDDPTELRPPIVTVMGHVDHGKTSLLDRIRTAEVAEGEAGGITQHIGAYRVLTPKGTITFLDTPGHEAFTAMRARGAEVTDIVILVVAADDGVMPQTREAIAHAKSANVPMIVAVNKIDKPGADPSKVSRQLMELGLVSEELGGETIFVPVSAKTGQGIEQLLEMTALQAEILELRANSKRPATGTVIEALLDRGKGPVARVLVTDGTLHAGDIVIAGPAWGKVRAMTDEHGKNLTEAGPSTPVELLGLSDVPNAGDPVHVLKDSKKAQEIAESRKTKVKNLIPGSAKVSLEDLAKRIAEQDQLELRLIVKADVQGSVEAVSDALAKLSTEKVRVAIVHAAAGGITEGDVNLAVASKAIIVGFSVRPAGKAASLAESEGVEIRLYNIIYNAVDDVRKAMQGLLAPTLVEKPLGKAEVRQLFKIGKVGNIAGCMVIDGTIKRAGKARLVRDAVQVWEGKIGGLRRFKDDASSVEKGMDCGILLDGYQDVKAGDVIECFEVEEVAATL